MAESLFNKVYNPDVLSCLANLSNDEVFTPPEIVNQMLDMLPQELFQNPDIRIFRKSTNLPRRRSLIMRCKQAETVPNQSQKQSQTG